MPLLHEEDNGKTVCKFSLVPEGKQKLQAFFDARFKELKSPRPNISTKAMTELVKLVRGEPEGTGIFPKECLEELHNIVAGKSEMALLLTDCPERTEIKKDRIGFAADSYATYLSQALYAIASIDTTNRIVLRRNSHQQPKHIKANVDGGYWHRDMTSLSGDDSDFCSQYIILTSPCNDEHAVTDVMNLKAAVAAIPQTEREAFMVSMTLKDKSIKTISAQALHEQLQHETLDMPVRQLLRTLHPVDGHKEQFAQHFKGTPIDLQPGELLFFDENTTLHRANAGDRQDIQQIPHDSNFSRILLHLAGKKGEGRAF